MTELEEEIRQIINDVTEREYITKLHVSQDGDIWTLYLYMDRDLVPPIVMSKQGSLEDFKKFIKREMRKRRLEEVKYWKTTREIPVLSCKDGELEIGW